MFLTLDKIICSENRVIPLNPLRLILTAPFEGTQ